MPAHTEPETSGIAEQIMQYFEHHPHARDTVEGITRWWLVRQRFETSLELVQRALDHLVAESKIERKPTPGGKDLYALAPTKPK